MLTFTDIFCGAGGSSIGLAAAGFQLRLAANHWDRAIETHAANFADAEHLCADVNNYDMRRLPRTDVLWASPICTESSPAGKKTRRRARQVDGQGDLLQEFGPVDRAGFDRTRATFHDVIRATEVHRYRAVLVENVPEVATEWELFFWWVDGMVKLGYRVQYVSVSSAHIGGPDNPHAPQWRDRLYLVFTRTGIPAPDVDPRPLARCIPCGHDVRARQAWKKSGPRIGRYRAQYAYICPNTTCGHATVEPYVLPAAAAIDWSNLGQRIGDRRQPLAENTLRRIEAGLRKFARPVMVNANHDDDRLRPADGWPLPARTTKIGDGIAVPPLLVPSGGTWAEAAMSATNEPMRTRTANPKGFECLFTSEPFITVLRNNVTARPIGDPLDTIAAQGRHHYLTVPPGAFLVKNYSGNPHRMVKPVDQPLATVVASGAHHALVVPYYRTGVAKSAAGEPFDTVTTLDRFGLATATQAVDINDCRYRMVQPRESLRAQRFPDSYIVTGNRGEQTMQAGNAVSANVAQWLGQRLAAVLGGGAA